MYNRHGHHCVTPYLAASLALAFKFEFPLLLPVAGNFLSNKIAGTEAV